MGDLLDSILDLSEIYDKYGLKGCLLFILAVVLLIGVILGIAWLIQ